MTRLEMIEEAIELINEAQALVDQAVDGLSIQGNYEAYGRYGFDTLLGRGNSYDDSLETIITVIQENGEDDDEEADDE